MRKKTISCLCDNIFWHLIYLLPLILVVGVTFETGTLVSLSTAFQTLGLDIISTNPIFTTLQSIFGSTGIVPLFNNVALLEYISYFVSAYLIHMCVDFLLFIPRFAMNFLNKLYGEGGE